MNSAATSVKPVQFSKTMSNTKPTTILGWIEQAKQEGYVWADGFNITWNFYGGNEKCDNMQSCIDRLFPIIPGIPKHMWRHYHPDRVPKTDVYWIIRMGDDPQKAVLTEYGGAFFAETGIEFDPKTILFFHQINAPAGPEM